MNAPTNAERVRDQAIAIGSGRERYIHGTAYYVACAALNEEPDPGLIYERDTDEDTPHTRMVTLAFVLAMLCDEERQA